MPYSGVDQNPYPNTTDVPDGPGAFLALAQRLTLMKGAGIGYASDATALAAMITNGDAFTGFRVYHAAADCIVRYNGSAFKLAGTKIFATAAAQTSWTATYSALLEIGSDSVRADAGIEDRWSGSAWRPYPSFAPTASGTGVTNNADGSITLASGGVVTIDSLVGVKKLTIRGGMTTSGGTADPVLVVRTTAPADVATGYSGIKTSHNPSTGAVQATSVSTTNFNVSRITPSGSSFSVDLTGLGTATPTVMSGSYDDPTFGAGHTVGHLLTTTAYGGVKITFPSGTSGTMWVEASY